MWVAIICRLTAADRRCHIEARIQLSWHVELQPEAKTAVVDRRFLGDARIVHLTIGIVRIQRYLKDLAPGSISLGGFIGKTGCINNPFKCRRRTSVDERLGNRIGANILRSTN